MCQPQFPKCLLSYCLTKQAFWSLTAAKPVLGPSSPQHNLQPCSRSLCTPQPLLGTGVTCQVLPCFPPASRNASSPTKTLQWSFSSRIWNTPRVNSILCTYWEFTKAWLLLTCSTISFFFAAILLQEQGPLSSCPKHKALPMASNHPRSKRWPTCSTERAF